MATPTLQGEFTTFARNYVNDCYEKKDVAYYQNLDRVVIPVDCGCHKLKMTFDFGKKQISFACTPNKDTHAEFHAVLNHLKTEFYRLVSTLAKVGHKKKIPWDNPPT